MVKCPKCGKEGQALGKEWDYSIYHVKLFKCTEDRQTFKAYYRDGKITHTIPKTKI